MARANGPAPALAADKPKRSRPSKTDPVELARADARRSDVRALSLISRSVPYSAFMDADPPIGVGLFEEIRGIALVDAFFIELSDAEVCAKLGVSPDHLGDLRRHPHYEPVKAAMRESARRLSAPRTLDDMAEAIEPEVAREMYSLAMSCGSPREQLKALEAFADRRSAKKGREQQEGAGLLLPERFVEALELGLRMEKHLIESARAEKLVGSGSVPAAIGAGDEQVIEISASVVNVPREADE